MADKNFGVKKIELIGSSGTPNLTSPTNLNLNAVTVAISTDVTIGGKVQSDVIVGTGYSVGIGTTNPTSALTVQGDISVSGIATINGITVQSPGSENIYIGDSAGLLRGSSDSSNVAIGYQAARNSDGMDRNVTIGTRAGENVQSNWNTIIGYEAGKSNSGTPLSGAHNTLIGYEAGLLIQGSSFQNTFVGSGAGDEITSGDNNTILGRFNGNQNGLDIRTSSNNVVLSDGDGNIRFYVNPSGDVGIGTTNPTNAAIHVEGRNFAFGGPGGNESGAGNLYLGNYDDPLKDPWDRNIRIGSRNEIQINMFTDWGGTPPNNQYSNSSIFSSPDSFGILYNNRRNGIQRNAVYPLYYTISTSSADDDNLSLFDNSITGKVNIKGSGEVLIGSATTTGTSNQKLQVTGGGYFSGDVSIGTTNPTNATLEVNGNAYINNILTVSYDGSPQLYIDAKNQNYPNILFTGTPASTGLNDTQMGEVGFNGVRDRELKVWSIGTIALNAGTFSTTDGLFVNDNDIGIGITNPSAKLDVRGGDIKVGIDTSTGLILTSPNGTQYRLTVDNSGNLSTTAV